MARPGLAELAWQEAGRALAESLPMRWNHVRRAMAQAVVVTGRTGVDSDALAAAAIAHDIGYAEHLVATGFHAIDGARHLRRLGMDDVVVRLVAHHSCAAVEADMRGLASELAEFEPAPEDLYDRLVYCDMTSGPSGELFAPAERLAEIAVRHAGNPIVEQFLVRARSELLGACARVEQTLVGP